MGYNIVIVQEVKKHCWRRVVAGRGSCNYCLCQKEQNICSGGELSSLMAPKDIQEYDQWLYLNYLIA